MGGALRVLLPPTSVHLVPLVLEAGAVPVVDATGNDTPEVPDGAWVRTRPGRPAPGRSGVILAELGAPVPGRETWLETAMPRPVPPGFAGLVLKGREAGGLCGEADGLFLLSQCPEPGRVLLDAGVGPGTAAAAAALGAAGVLLVEQHLAAPELDLHADLDQRLDLADDEISCVVAGVRVANPATAPVLRRLSEGHSPWALAQGVWEQGDLRQRVWAMGQGLALARGLAERHGHLRGLLEAYAAAWRGWPARVAAATSSPTARPVGTAAALAERGTAAGSGQAVGTAVLWEEAAWIGRPVHGEPLRAALATGCPVVCEDEALAREAERALEGVEVEAEPPPPPARPDIAAEAVEQFLAVTAAASGDDLDASRFTEAVMPAVQALLQAALQASSQVRAPEADAEPSARPEEEPAAPPEPSARPEEDPSERPEVEEEDEVEVEVVAEPPEWPDVDFEPVVTSDDVGFVVHSELVESTLELDLPTDSTPVAAEPTFETEQDRLAVTGRAQTSAGTNPELLVQAGLEALDAAFVLVDGFLPDPLARAAALVVAWQSESPAPQALWLASALGFAGPAHTVAAGEVTWALALATAQATIAAGAPLALVVGTAGPVGTALVLEEAAHAAARGVRPVTRLGAVTLAPRGAVPPEAGAFHHEATLGALVGRIDWWGWEEGERCDAAAHAAWVEDQLGDDDTGAEPIPLGPGPEPAEPVESAVPIELTDTVPIVDDSDLEIAVDFIPDDGEQALPAWSTPPLPDSFRLRRPVLVPREESLAPSLLGHRILVLGSGSLAETIKAEIAARSGSLDGPYTAVIDAGDDVLKSLVAARQLDLDRPGVWVTVTRFGRLDGPLSPGRAFRDGARAGFAKALGHEWDGTRVKVLDVDPDLDEAGAAAIVCGELPVSGAVEVFWTGGARHVVQYEMEDLPAPGTVPPGAVVLITGGGRGVCARVGVELARRGPVRLVLAGRGPMAEEPLDLAAERERIESALLATGSRAPEVEVERRLEPLRRGEEVRRNVAQMEALGASVEYLRCDLSDPGAAVSLLEEVKARHGSLHAVIHGAGVAESRLLADKDAPAFHRVFDGKARGGLALLGELDEEVPFVSMGSVAGRFGSAGQVDYAAANEALARLCRTRPRALHAVWTAWDDVGMAVRDGLRHLLQQGGVDLLPADAGAALLVDLLSARADGELVVAGRLGSFFPPPDHPLLDHMEMDGDVVRMSREMSLRSEPWCRDYHLEKRPTLPVAVGLELMAAVADAVRPKRGITGYKRVQCGDPLVLPVDESIQVLVEGVPVAEGEVQCRLLSERPGPAGATTRTEHLSAVVLVGEHLVDEPLPSAFFPPEELAVEEVYRRLERGPSFQVLRTVLGVARDGLLVQARVEPVALSENLLTPALVLETALQSAMLHTMVVDGRRVRLAAVDRVQFLERVEPTVPLEAMVHRHGTDSYDLDVDGGSGGVLRVRGLVLADLGPLEVTDLFPEPPGGRPACIS